MDTKRWQLIASAVLAAGGTALLAFGYSMGGAAAVAIGAVTAGAVMLRR